MPKIRPDEPINSEQEFLSGWSSASPATSGATGTPVAPVNLPRLPGNVIEWFERPGYLFPPEIISSQRDPKTGLYLFPKAFVTLRDFFDLACPYCQDVSKIDKTPAEEQDFQKQVLLRYGKCPQCEVSLVDVQRAKRANNALECVLALGMGSGKLLDLATPIPTPTGWTTMGDLNDGDMVLDDQGKPCRVVKAHDIVTETEAYRVVFRGGFSVVADARHPWMTLDHCARKNISRNRKGKRERRTWNAAAQVRTTKEIADTLYPSAGPRGGWNHHIPMAEALDLPEVELPVDPYVLGVWLGDGTSAAAQYTKPDPEIAEQIRLAGENVRPIPGSPDKCQVWSLAGKHPKGRMLTRLRELGVLGNKRIPAVYLRASIKQRLALLQGLMDTDGSCSTDGKCEFTTTTKELGEGFEELCLSLQIRTNSREGRARLNGRDMGPKWRFSFTTDVEVFRLPRKRDRWLGRPPGMSTENWAIVAVEPVPSVPMRCITVDSPSRLYLCGKGMIPTHNTALLAGVESYTAAVAASLPSVRAAFGFAPGAPMELAFVASTGAQAKKTIWAYFTTYLLGSPWWNRYRKAAEAAKAAGLAEEMLDDGTTVWRFPSAGFECQSLHSNSGGLAGLRRMGVAIDELARFDTEGRRGANEVYQVLIGSMQNTWRAYDKLLDEGNIPPFKPFVGACSSPIHEGDKIMTLGAEAERNPASRIYFQNMPTWEWNPHFQMEDFAREFAREPRRAERDYGAKPMGLNERLLPPGVVERCIDIARPNLVRTGEQFYRDRLGTPMVKTLLQSCAMDRTTPRFVHGDAGHRRDSFGLVGGHSERDTQTGIVRVVLDAIIEARPWTPPGQPIRYEIDFDAVGDILLELGKRWLLARGTFDQWQSVTQIQRLRAAGHDFQRVELKPEDWQNLRDLAESGRLVLPATESEKYDRDDRRSPVRKLVYELSSMELRGSKIDHPADGSSDLAVCACGVVKLALENSGMMIDMKGKSGRPVPPGWTTMASMASIPRHRRIGSAVRLHRW